MKLCYIIDVSPEDSSIRQARGDQILEVVEEELEALTPEIEGQVYLVTVLGAGKTPMEASSSAIARREAFNASRS